MTDLNAYRRPTVFASAIKLGSQLVKSGGAAIFLNASNDENLNIVIAPTECTPATLVDVPLASIVGVGSVESFIPEPTFALQIDLAVEAGEALRINAASFSITRLLITFDSSNDRSTTQAALDKYSKSQSYTRGYIDSWSPTRDPLHSLVVDLSELCDASKFPSEPMQASISTPSKHLDAQIHQSSLVVDLSEMCDASRIQSEPRRAPMSALPNPIGLQDDKLANDNTASRFARDSQASSQISTTDEPPAQDQSNSEQSDSISSASHNTTTAKPPLLRSHEPQPSKLMATLSRTAPLESANEASSQKSYGSGKMQKDAKPMPHSPIKNSQITKSINRDARVSQRITRRKNVNLATAQALDSSLPVRQNMEDDESSEDKLSGFKLTSIEHKAGTHVERANMDTQPAGKLRIASQRQAKVEKSQGTSKKVSVPAPTFTSKISSTKAAKPQLLANFGSKAASASVKPITVNDDLWDPETQSENEDKAKLRKKPNQGKKRAAKPVARDIPQRLAKTKANKKLEDQLSSEQMGDDAAIESAVQREVEALELQISAQPSNHDNGYLLLSSKNKNAAISIRSPGPKEAREQLPQLRKASEEADHSSQKLYAESATQPALGIPEGKIHHSLDGKRSIQSENEHIIIRKEIVADEEPASLNPNESFVPDSFPNQPNEDKGPSNNYGRGKRLGKADPKNNETLNFRVECKRPTRETFSQQELSMTNSTSVEEVTALEHANAMSIPEPQNSILAEKGPQDPVAARLEKMLGHGWAASSGGNLEGSHRRSKPSVTFPGGVSIGSIHKMNSPKLPPTKTSELEHQTKYSNHGGPVTPKRTKRKAETAGMKPSKRSKMETPLERSDDTEIKGTYPDPKMHKAKPVRKPPIIHFTPAGPQNQGIAADADLLKQNILRSANKDNIGHQRTGAQEPSSKLKWKSDRRVKPNVKDAALPLIDATNRANRAGIERLNNRGSLPSGSQRKITEDGSPIILSQNGEKPIYQLNDSSGDDIVETGAEFELDDDGDYFMHDENQVMPNLVTIARSTKSKECTSKPPPLVSKKQQPSSPLAPSIHASLQEHYIQDNGDILNTRTKEAVIPSKPQDPFVANSKPRDNSFIDKLRKATNKTVNKPVRKSNEGRQPGGVAKNLIVQFDDNDTTLLESPPPRKSRRIVRTKLIELSSCESSESLSEGESLVASETSSASFFSEDSTIFEPHQEELYLLMCDIVKVRF